MWPRAVEIMLGCWLAISPFIFVESPEADVRVLEIFAGGAVITISCLACWRRLRYAHLAILIVASVLVAIGYFAGERPGPPWRQNYILTGLLLMMFAIIPSESSEPPLRWRKFLHE